MEGDAGLEKLLGFWERFEFFIWGHHSFIPITFPLPSLGISEDLREETGAVVVDVRNQMLLVEAIDLRCKLLRDVAITKNFTYDSCVL